MTALGLAVRKAWRELPEVFPDLQTGDLQVKASSLEGALHFRPGGPHPELTEVVLRYKQLCQAHFARLRDEPSDLWVPGFIESR